ncbi:preprotein translocase subunit YajC [Corynebacterium phocae]|uniref:preprotein translocase subunit YajC n=1 Tax=Corynebacterium phocae TaxID=161895 RepID=UPI000950FB10|nr:preprotein translocase subunit YajC [Corynebacterium phocae]KAA8725018.1 preprotein translocase subunit YajC [Corynebacterium phocae]
MEIIFLLAVILIIFVPQFLLMRKQKAAQQQILQFQASLEPGQRVVTAGGFHVTVTGVGEDTIEAELTPGTVVTLEKSAIMRAEPVSGLTPGEATSAPVQGSSSHQEPRGAVKAEDFGGHNDALPETEADAYPETYPEDHRGGNPGPHQK